MSLTTILVMLCLAAALALTVYCRMLARRLRGLNDLEEGLGGAIAVMTSEISRLDQSVRRARAEAEAATNDLARAIESARSEKAYWTLQSELSKTAHSTSRRLRPRAQSAGEYHA